MPYLGSAADWVDLQRCVTSDRRGELDLGPVFLGDLFRMKPLFISRSLPVALGLVFAIVGLWTARSLAAQGTSTNAGAEDRSTVRSVEERVKIQPYTGKPIYLDEPGQIAPPTIIRHETKTDEYRDGTKRAERQLAIFSDDHFEADGLYREYYISGKPFVEGKYSRGRQEGEWTYWYENGTVNRKATYKDGQPDGSWEVRREDGTLLAKRGFKDGQRHGEWIVFDKTGEQPVAEEHYDNGKADGVWKVWFPNGKQKTQVSFKQGNKDGLSTEWTDKGEKRIELNFADNKYDGQATFWLPDGKKIVQQYKAGRLVSESKD
jgi:antitoxin component YwqK of YwqJK toxin-antitoxin module